MTDWSKCPAVESVPGRVSGAWVFKDTRLPRVLCSSSNLAEGATDLRFHRVVRRGGRIGGEGGSWSSSCKTLELQGRQGRPCESCSITECTPPACAVTALWA